MAENKDIKYFNRDFAGLKNLLVDFSKTYFPDTYNDFSPSSPGTMFMEMSAYVGDVLSFYLDNQIQETFLQYAKQAPSLYSLAYMLGYRPKVTKAATVDIDFYQQVPSKLSGSDYVPDFDYALLFAENTQLKSNAGDNYFIVQDAIDFTSSSSFDPTETTVYQISAGNPQYFLLKKTRKAISAQIQSDTFSFGTPTAFSTVTLEAANIIQILDITDSDGNVWYEVPYLGQEMVYVPLKNTNGLPWRDPRTLQGELLWPECMGGERLAEFKSFLGSSYNIAGQLQQRPSPADGGVLLKSWFQHWEYEKLPKFKYYLQSWDTAMSTAPTAAYSAMTTWGVWDDPNGIPNVMLISMWRGRVEYPELKKYIIRFANDFSDMYPDLSKPPRQINKPDIILMEAKANGLSLIQDINRTGILITKFDPSLHSIGASKYGSKVVRARLVSPILEAGRVWVPAKPPLYNSLYKFADTFVDACATFPNAESNDLVDSMSQALSRLIKSGWIFTPDNKIITPRPNYKAKALY